MSAADRWWDGQQGDKQVSELDRWEVHQAHTVIVTHERASCLVHQEVRTAAVRVVLAMLYPPCTM